MRLGHAILRANGLQIGSDYHEADFYDSHDIDSDNVYEEDDTG